MRVRNVSGVARGVTPPYSAHFVADVDETVEVDDGLGKSLLEQPSNWQPVREATNNNKDKE